MYTHLLKAVSVLGLISILFCGFVTTAQAFTPVINMQGEVADYSSSDSLAPDIESLSPVSAELPPEIKLSAFYAFPVKSTDFKGFSQLFSRTHPGYDIRAKYGAPVYSILDGVVVKTEYQAGGYGRYVFIRHANGLFTLYAHLKEAAVVEGQKVDAKTVIGYVGLTGHTSGPHVHFELHTANRTLNPGLVLPETQPKAVNDSNSHELHSLITKVRTTEKSSETTTTGPSLEYLTFR